MKRSVQLCLGLLGILLASDGVAATAWLDAYTFRRMLTVTNLAAVGSDQTNFPILVKFANANFSFQNANTNGYDVRFTAADGTTLLSYERERHSAGTAQAEYWVKLPLLSATTQANIYVYYTPAAKTDGANPTNVWDASFRFVHHLEEGSGSYLDSTANAITGTPNSVWMGRSGYIDGAVWNNTGGFITLAPITSRPFEATYEAWFKADSTAGQNYLFLFSGANFGYQLRFNSSSNVQSFLHTGNAIIYNTATNTLALGEWHYVTDIYSSSQGRKLYVDGVLEASTEDYGVPYALWFESNQWISYGFAGTVDEARMSTSVRSADWIKAQNASMRDQLLSFGAEEGTSPAWLAGYRYRRMLAVTNTASVVSNLVNFPVLVKLSAANFNFSKANADGHDIRFTAADGVTLLSYERERHSAGTTQAEYWVKLPILSAGITNVFYIYYAPQVLADGADPTNVWGADYAFVYHMNQTNGSAFVYDSTANAITGTPASVTLGAAGYVNGGVENAGAGNIILNAFTRPNPGTMEMWFKLDTLGVGSLYTMDWPGHDTGYMLSVLADGKVRSYIHTGGAIIYYESTNSVPTGEWHYLADIYGDAAAPARKMYVDGVLNNSTNNPGVPGLVYDVSRRIAELSDGTLDEVRFSKVVRSAEWVKAQNASMRDQLLSYGPEGFGGSSGTVILVR